MLHIAQYLKLRDCNTVILPRAHSIHLLNMLVIQDTKRHIDAEIRPSPGKARIFRH